MLFKHGCISEITLKAKLPGKVVKILVGERILGG